MPDFETVDLECFPDEPLDEATFQVFLSRDFWAAWDKDQFVGYCGVQRKPDLAWLRRIGVKSDHRQRGIARRLMQAALDCNQRSGFSETLLYVQDDNGPALGLYESLGFRKSETTYQYELNVVELNAVDTLSNQGPLVVRQVNEVPSGKMPELPRQWTDIATMHSPPHQYVFVFHDYQENCVGYCRLTPGFPGCFPFAVKDPVENLMKVLRGLNKYLLPGKDTLKLTIDDRRVAEACESLGFHLNYTLYRMIRKEGG